MPAHFDFCLRVEANSFAPRRVMDSLLDFFVPIIGSPREVMRLNYRSGEDSTVAWSGSSTLLDLPLAKDELLFIHLAVNPDARGSRSSIHVEHGEASWVFCISLIDQDLAVLAKEDDLIQIGINLYERIKQFSDRPLLVAGGYELSIGGKLQSLSAVMEQVALKESLVDFAIYPEECKIPYDEKRYFEGSSSGLQVLKRN